MEFINSLSNYNEQGEIYMEQSLNSLQQSLRYDPDIFAFVEWRDEKNWGKCGNRSYQGRKNVIKTAILKEQNTKED